MKHKKKKKSTILFRIQHSTSYSRFSFKINNPRIQKKITNHLNDSKIAITSNKIENCFLKNFPKHIKKLFKSEKGILKRFDLKLMY